MVDTYENWYNMGMVNGEVEACLILSEMALDSRRSADEVALLNKAMKMIQDDYRKRREEVLS